MHGMQVAVRAQPSWVDSFTERVLGIQVRKQGLEVSTFAYQALSLNSAPTSRLNFSF